MIKEGRQNVSWEIVTVTKLCAWIASEEITIVFISKVKDKNLLWNVHLIITFICFISNGTTFSSPWFHRITSPFANRWFTRSQAVFNVTLENDAVTFGETESFINRLQSIAIGSEAREDAVVNGATGNKSELVFFQKKSPSRHSPVIVDNLECALGVLSHCNTRSRKNSIRSWKHKKIIATVSRQHV